MDRQAGPMSSTEAFALTYIQAWSTADADERHQLVEQVYAEDASFFADEPGDDAIERHGRAEIAENITQVNERLTQGAGLSTVKTGLSENHDVLRVAWQMTAPDGTVALTGMNLLTRGSDGLISRDYIFIG